MNPQQLLHTHPRIQSLIFILGSSLIVLFFSEFFFFNEGPVYQVLGGLSNPAELLSTLAQLTFFYALVTAPFIWIVQHFQINSVARLFLAGGLLGYMIEGLMVPVMYFELPFSLLWTALSWHPIINVLIGWYLLQRVLRQHRTWLTVLTCTALGVVWGIWSTWPIGSESEMTDGVVAALPLTTFLLYAAVTTSLLFLGNLLCDRAAISAFIPSKAGRWTIYSIVGLLYVVIVLSVSILSLALPVVVALLWYLLYRTKPGTAPKDTYFERTFGIKVPLWKQSLIFITPLTATGAYYLATDFEIVVEPGLVSLPLMLGALYLLVQGGRKRA